MIKTRAAIIATKIAEEKGGKIPDQRILKDKVVSYMGIGGSDWTTRIHCDHGLQAMTPMIPFQVR